MPVNKRFWIAGAAAIALISFCVLAITSENRRALQSKAAQEKTADEDTVEIVPIPGNARIEIAPAPVYESKSPMAESTLKLDQVESPSNAEFFFSSRGKIEGMPNLSKSGVYRAVEETRSLGLPGGVSLACKVQHKFVLEVRVLGGRIDRNKKPAVLVNIELEVKNFDAENITTCEVSPGGVMPSQTKVDDGHKAKWWRTALYNWPFKDGHSEVVGRFQYTLHIKQDKGCEKQFSQSMDELRGQFDQWVENCIKKSGVVTECDTFKLRECALSIYSGEKDTSIIDDCVNSACDAWEEGLVQCLREAMSIYMARLIEIEKQYKECLGK